MPENQKMSVQAAYKITNLVTIGKTEEAARELRLAIGTTAHKEAARYVELLQAWPIENVFWYLCRHFVLEV